MAKDKMHAVGKRKTAIARVWLKPGSGEIVINKRPMGAYYTRPTLHMLVTQPLELTDTAGKYDVFVNVVGGGLAGQAGAIRHGISRILAESSEDFHKILKKSGLLTRDSRKKERKIYGRPSARARFQFSKR